MGWKGRPRPRRRDALVTALRTCKTFLSGQFQSLISIYLDCHLYIRKMPCFIVSEWELLQQKGRIQNTSYRRIEVG